MIPDRQKVFYSRIELDLNILAQCVVRVPNWIVANCRYPLKMRMVDGPEMHG